MTQPEDSSLPQGRLNALRARISALKNQKSGDLQRAKGEFAKALESDPNDVVCLYSLAVIASEQDDLDQALTLIDRAIATHPGFAPSFLARSIIHARRGVLDAALNDLEAAETLDPGLDGIAEQRAALRALF